jgi:uncharacterized membrane-anchored protein
MKLTARQRSVPLPPGIHGPARVDRRTRSLLPRLRPGDVAVLDHRDMDRATAQSLVDAGVAAVLNASPMISGRYANLGPEVLVSARVPVVDTVGTDVLTRLKDGAAIRVHEGRVYVAEDLVAEGRPVDSTVVRAEMDAARVSMASQLESFTHNSTEFLRREEDLLLHGRGVPRPATRIRNRPVVVVVPGADHAAELAAIQPYIREQHPVLVGVDAGADALRRAGHTPDVVVVDCHATGTDLPSSQVLRAARDVVVVVERGAARSATEAFERAGVRPLRFESGATTEDAALILADTGEATLIVGVGMHATLEEFLDRQRAGLASTYLTRLKVGPRLVDAASVPHLYDGQVRPRHLVAVLLAGLVALAAAIGVTPVGQEWADAAAAQTADIVDHLQGLFS